MKQKTDFFVPQEKELVNGGETPKRIDLELLLVGKRLGLTFSEINELRVQDIVALVDMYTKEDDEKPRPATQSDIDSFFG